jgi:hypothetical protein
MLADFVNGADVRVIERGCCTSFATKTFQSLRVLRCILREKFEGDKSAEGNVFCLVHHAHPTATQFLDDAVVRDGLADHWAEILGLEIGQVNESRAVVDV